MAPFHFFQQYQLNTGQLWLPGPGVNGEDRWSCGPDPCGSSLCGSVHSPDSCCLEWHLASPLQDWHRRMQRALLCFPVVPIEKYHHPFSTLQSKRKVEFCRFLYPILSAKPLFLYPRTHKGLKAAPRRYIFVFH